MRQHFPEIIGLSFAGALVLVFVFASALGSPGVVLGGAGAIGVGAFARNLLKKKA